MDGSEVGCCQYWLKITGWGLKTFAQEHVSVPASCKSAAVLTNADKNSSEDGNSGKLSYW